MNELSVQLEMSGLPGKSDRHLEVVRFPDRRPTSEDLLFGRATLLNSEDWSVGESMPAVHLNLQISCAGTGNNTFQPRKCIIRMHSPGKPNPWGLRQFVRVAPLTRTSQATPIRSPRSNRTPNLRDRWQRLTILCHRSLECLLIQSQHDFWPLRRLILPSRLLRDVSTDVRGGRGTRKRNDECGRT